MIQHFFSSFCLSIALFSRFHPFNGCLPFRPLDSRTHTCSLAHSRPFVPSPFPYRIEYVSIFSASQTYFIPCWLAVRGFLLFVSFRLIIVIIEIVVFVVASIFFVFLLPILAFLGFSSYIVQFQQISVIFAKETQR